MRFDLIGHWLARLSGPLALLALAIPLSASHCGGPHRCSDSTDNDGDFLTDFPNDPGCPTEGSTAEDSPNVWVPTDWSWWIPGYFVDTPGGEPPEERPPGLSVAIDGLCHVRFELWDVDRSVDLSPFSVTAYDDCLEVVSVSPESYNGFAMVLSGSLHEQDYGGYWTDGSQNVTIPYRIRTGDIRYRYKHETCGEVAHRGVIYPKAIGFSRAGTQAPPGQAECDVTWSEPVASDYDCPGDGALVDMTLEGDYVCQTTTANVEGACNAIIAAAFVCNFE